MERKTYVIITASGQKSFIDIDGKPILRRTMEIFTGAVPGIRVVTVLPRDYIRGWKDYCLSSGFDVPQEISEGGITRFHSVRAALSKVPDGAIVAIHDGLRPLVSKELVSRMFSLMDDGRRAVIPVVGSDDSFKSLRLVKFEDGSERFEEDSQPLPDRSRIWTAQTPQLFIAEDIREAYAQAYDTAFTDDASVAARKGIPLTWTRGERYNLRITAPEDVVLARLVISSPLR